MTELMKSVIELEDKYVILIDDNGKKWQGYLESTTTAADNETAGKEMWSLSLKIEYYPNRLYSFFEDEITSIELDKSKY